jgi:hypothetical protein
MGSEHTIQMYARSITRQKRCVAEMQRANDAHTKCARLCVDMEWLQYQWQFNNIRVSTTRLK